MSLDALKVGEKITVCHSDHQPISIRTVAKVTKTSIVDSKGSRWTISGREWGSDRFSRSWCSPWKPEDDARAEESEKELIRIRRRNMVIHFNYSHLDDATLNKIWEILKSHLAEKAKKRESVAHAQA